MCSSHSTPIKCLLNEVLEKQTENAGRETEAKASTPKRQFLREDFIVQKEQAPHTHVLKFTALKIPDSTLTVPLTEE